MQGDEAQRLTHHVRHLDAPQGAALGQRRSQQDGKGDFVELNAGPEGFAAEPLVLAPVPVLVLTGDEIAQRIARFLLGAQGQ